MASRELVFGSRELSGLVRTYMDNSRNETFTDIFKKGQDMQSWDPNKVEWDEDEFSQLLAPFVGRSDAAPTTGRPKQKNKRAPMAKIAHVIEVPGEAFFYERDTGSLKPDAKAVSNKALMQGMNKVKRSIELLAALSLLDNLVINAGVVPGSKTSFGTAGNIGCDTIDASDWSNTATLIATQKVKAICDQFRQNSGLLPSQLWLNSTTEGYLLENVEIQSLLHSFAGAYAILQSSHKGAAVMNGLGIGDLNWRKHLGGYRLTEGGNWVDYMPTDKAIILPEDGALPGVLGFAEGFNMVPVGVWGNGGDVTGQLVRAEKKGLTVYTQLKSNPWRVEFVFEWTGMTLVLFPKAVLVASV